MQSDGTVSHVHSWKPCMTLHHMCILHTSTSVTIQAAHWALRVWMCGLFCFFKFTSPTFTPSFPPPLARHHFCFSVYLCARACIWHLSGGLRVMPWSCRKLGHCSTVRSEMPRARNCIPPHVIQGDGKQWNNRVLSADPHCPKTNKLSSFPLQLGCNYKKFQLKWNSLRVSTVGEAMLSCNPEL